ncbi:MAG: hypothetical protein JO100_04890 [Pseudonocardia sp.]|nr:hypothetical protein [Pseudonocardia sp.]
MRKGRLTAALMILATVSVVVFGGVALAHNSGGGGKGGSATNDCVNVGVDLLAEIGLAGRGVANPATCSASANGTSGSAY